MIISRQDKIRFQQVYISNNKRNKNHNPLRANFFFFFFLLPFLHAPRHQPTNQRYDQVADFFDLRAPTSGETQNQSVRDKLSLCLPQKQ